MEKKEEYFQRHQIRLISLDIEKEGPIPFEDEYFDVVTMLAVFEHIDPKRLPNILAEIYRILKFGGIYIMTTPTAWTDNLLKLLAKLRLVSPVEIEEHKSAYNHDQLRSLFQNANFAKERLRFGYFEMFMNIWAVATK